MYLCIAYRKAAVVRCILALLMAAAIPASADNNVNLILAQNSGKSSNPWALQEEPEPSVNSERLYRYQNPQNDNYQRNNRAQQDRFVTPQILQSLKRQQSLYQLESPTGNYQQTMPYPSQQRQYAEPRYGQPSYGMNYSPGMNYPPPIYDVPTTSPWANSPDLLYQGESFPLVPNEAIGGLPPMQMPIYGNDNLDGMGMYEPGRQNENNVFNPYTFIPNDSLH